MEDHEWRDGCPRTPIPSRARHPTLAWRRRNSSAGLRCLARAAVAALVLLPCIPLCSTASTAQPVGGLDRDFSRLAAWLQSRVAGREPGGHDVSHGRRLRQDHPFLLARALASGAVAVSRLRGGIEDWEREYEEEAHLYTQGGTNAADQQPREELPKAWEDVAPECIFEEGEEVPDISKFYRYIQENPPPEGPPPGDGKKDPEVDDDHNGWLKEGMAWEGIDPRLKSVNSPGTCAAAQFLMAPKPPVPLCESRPACSPAAPVTTTMPGISLAPPLACLGNHLEREIR